MLYLKSLLVGRREGREGAKEGTEEVREGREGGGTKAGRREGKFHSV